MKILDILLEDFEKEQEQFEQEFGKPIWHGTEKLHTGTYTQTLRTKSTDTFIPVHNTLSALSKEKLGIDVRALMFGSMDRRQAADFGSTYRVIPLGSNYRIFVADGVRDFTRKYEINGGTVGSSIIAVLFEHLDKYDVSPFYIESVENTVWEVFSKYRTESSDIQLKGAYDDAYNIVLEGLPENDENSQAFLKNGTEAFKKDLEESYNSYYTPIKEYIGRLKEIKHADDIQDQSSELMIYAPDKVIIKR